MPYQQYVTLAVRMEGLALHLMNVDVLLDGVETHVHKVRVIVVMLYSYM